MNKNKKIAVVGGGIFGVTTAIKLAKAGYRVDLFERNRDILKEASGINQFRLHRGYHYPRSQETVSSLTKAEPSFRKEYTDAIIDDFEHFYCIAKKDSFVSADQFLSFCKKNSLEFSEINNLNIINYNKIDLCIKAKEGLINFPKLYDICWERLKKYSVNVNLNNEATEDKLSKYDLVVVSTYANQNFMFKKHVKEQKDYQYEICEKPVVSLGSEFNKKSLVIMDGPFMCVDPFGKTGLYLLGNVVHAIHQTNIGKYPIVSSKLKKLLNKGVIKNPPVTNIKKFLKSGSDFIPDLKNAKHIGSMFTIRTVLPHQDKTDTRPTIVNLINKRFITIFSGKIPNCVLAAEEVVDIVDKL